MTVGAIRKWGNSQGILIPKHIMKALNMDINDNVVIDYNGDTITIKPLPNDRLTVKRLFEGYEGDYKSEETDWGEPAGHEIW